MFTLNSFYKSTEWRNLIERLKLERVNADGDLICEHCGKPIIKAYDCIAHHKTELNDSNVNDFNISLNPENIMLIHFRCHNKIHERFGFVGRKVYIVYGAPCSGKSTFVNENARQDDLILDVDNLWQMISKNERYKKPNRLKQNVFGLRDCLLEQIKMRVGDWRTAWVVGGYPLKTERERLADILGAELVFIDETKEKCLLRAKKREGWENFIEDYFFDLQR